jgi:hypothetical protein
MSCLSKMFVVNKDNHNVVLDFIQAGYNTDLSTLLKCLPIKFIYHF